MNPKEGFWYPNRKERILWCFVYKYAPGIACFIPKDVAKKIARYFSVWIHIKDKRFFDIGVLSVFEKYLIGEQAKLIRAWYNDDDDDKVILPCLPPRGGSTTVIVAMIHAIPNVFSVLCIVPNSGKKREMFDCLFKYGVHVWTFSEYMTRSSEMERNAFDFVFGDGISFYGSVPTKGKVFVLEPY